MSTPSFQNSNGKPQTFPWGTNEFTELMYRSWGGVTSGCVGDSAKVGLHQAWMTPLCLCRRSSLPSVFPSLCVYSNPSLTP